MPDPVQGAPSWFPAGAVEGPAPRWVCSSATAGSAGLMYVSRCVLQAKPYTTVTVSKSSTLGTTLANAFFALYNANTMSLVAQSANVAAALAAQAVNSMGAYTMNYTVPVAGDHFIGLMIGSAVAM